MRWAKGLLALGIAALGLGVGVRLVRGHRGPDHEAERSEMHQAERPEAPRELPRFKTEEARRGHAAAATVRAMCAMLQREHVSAREFAERFGTGIEELGPGYTVFTPHEPVFHTPPDDLRALIRGERTPDSVAMVELHTADHGIIWLADLERELGKAIMVNPEDGAEIAAFPEPGSGPMHCYVHGWIWPSARTPGASVDTLTIERGWVDKDGSFSHSPPDPNRPPPPGFRPLPSPWRPAP